MTPVLRPYQFDGIERVEAEVAAGRRRVLLVAPTGAGQTVIGAELVRLAVARGEMSIASALIEGGLETRAPANWQRARRAYLALAESEQAEFVLWLPGKIERRRAAA